MICSMHVTPPTGLSQLGLARQLEKAARACLAGSGYAVLRQVKCEYHQGTLTLRGRVPSYYLKQIAQAKVLSCVGIMRIENSLQVEDGKSPGAVKT
ncbi:MAG: hypothetical protein KF708_20910 [Pirellulales bacterium]|nr:hypothetical protein [Pirellulales bacterium]